MPQVLLSYLKLRHYQCLFHSSKKRAERLTRLEIYGTVLYLYYHVVPKLSIKRDKLSICLFCTVLITGAIDECTPHYNTTIGLQCISNCVCSIHMRTSKILGTRLSLTVCLY